MENYGFHKPKIVVRFYDPAPSALYVSSYATVTQLAVVLPLDGSCWRFESSQWYHEDWYITKAVKAVKTRLYNIIG